MATTPTQFKEISKIRERVEKWGSTGEYFYHEVKTLLDAYDAALQGNPNELRNEQQKRFEMEAYPQSKERIGLLDVMLGTLEANIVAERAKLDVQIRGGHIIGKTFASTLLAVDAVITSVRLTRENLPKGRAARVRVDIVNV